MTERSPARPGRGWRRAVPGALVVLCLAVLGAGWVGVRGVSAHAHLTSAAELIGELRHALVARDRAAAQTTLAALQSETRAARSATTDPAWRAGGRLPGPGRNLAAVAAVAAALDDLAHQAFPTLVEITGTVDLSALVPKDGRLDLAPLPGLAPRLAAAHAAVVRVRDRVAAIPVGGLLPRLRAAVANLHSALDGLVVLTGTVARAAVLLPAMLGRHGPRTYLVLFQNPAEVRATGGMPGAFAVVRADHGLVRIIGQGTAARDLGVFDRPVLPLAPAMRSLYTDRLGTFPADINFTPHFPTTAALAREMYRLRTGTAVDGVLATDPVAVSYLLRATGPVHPPGGPPLTADNAVRVLLSEAYAHAGSPQGEDSYFAAAARAVFDALTRGVRAPEAVLAGLARAAGERRLLVWSASAQEQAAIAGTVLEGALPTQDGTRPTVGVFLNDGSGAKLGYYLTGAAQLRVGGCRRDGRRELLLRVTLGSAAPTTGLPEYVLGLGLAGDPYTVRTNVLLFSPAGGSVVDARLDGVPAPLGTGVERGRSVGVLTVDLPPGTVRTVQASLLTEPLPAGGALVTPRLWLTPGVNPWNTNIASGPGCPP